MALRAIASTATLVLSGCGPLSTLPVSAGVGPNPALPSAQKSIIPTVNIAQAIGWPAGAKPVGPSGTNVVAFASNLDHPRWLYKLPNGDILVAESNAPPKPEGNLGLRQFFMNLVLKKAGAKTVSANRITLLRDTDGDGVADVRSAFLVELNSPFGMALVGDTLYVANTDAIVKYPYRSGELKITSAGSQVIALPAGPINHHWTKNILASNDGKKLFVAIGSNSNVAERGLEFEVGRAAIWEVKLSTGLSRIFADGLRNPVGMAWAGAGRTLFTVVNERDELGNDLVPDYLTSVKAGGFYGWPFSYFGQHIDSRVSEQNPAKVAQAIVPDYALGSHTASLGLAWSGGTSVAKQFANGMFVGQHGSWNRKPHSGYKVIYVPFIDGVPAGSPVDVLTGFLSDRGQAFGRPVGVILDQSGSLLVADDVGNVIWRLSASAP